jgi:hypothetical protein
MSDGTRSIKLKCSLAFAMLHLSNPAVKVLLKKVVEAHKNGTSLIHLEANTFPANSIEHPTIWMIP